VIARLRESRTFFALNHLLYFYRRQVPLESYLQLLSHVPALEVRNGTMLAVHNQLLERVCQGGIAPSVPLARVAGSDAHTLRRIGRTWTEAPGTTAADFLASISAGLGRPGGSARKVRNAAAEGTMVTAWVRASQATSRYSANNGPDPAATCAGVNP